MIKDIFFQEEAVEKLRKTFVELWQKAPQGADIIFKAPTGSGKTIMIAKFLKSLAKDPCFETDKCFIWISFGGDTSYLQSKHKISNFFDGAGYYNFLDVSNVNNEKLENNDIFFINWSKLVSGKKEDKILRKESENVSADIDGGVFDEFIINTQNDGREIILIIDEAHREADTTLSNEVISLINPKLVIKVSATPTDIPNQDDIDDKKRGYVRVKLEDVIDEGLIKEKIITQTEEDIAKLLTEDKTIENLLLDVAIEKREYLKSEYEKLEKDINPLVLIQIPDKKKGSEELDEKTRTEEIKEYLISSGIEEENIAVWLSEKKENLDKIVKNNSKVSYLIFKQAVATGWDCPRAQILVMYREIQNPVFHTQTVGRILRMPEQKHYANLGDLNKAYLFTNYDRNATLIAYQNDKNKPAIYHTQRKAGINPIELKSCFLSRVDYNDLQPSDVFQKHLIEEFDKRFGTKFQMYSDNLNIMSKSALNLDTSELPLDIVVNLEIDDYDKLIESFEQSLSTRVNVSNSVIERLYNRLCFDVIQKQELPIAKYAPERSWSVLKQALNVWFENRLGLSKNEYYKIIVRDFNLKDSSVLKNVIQDILISYRPIIDKHLKNKKEKSKTEEIVEIPKKTLSYTDDFEIMNVEKSAMKEFYIRKSYQGKDNETKFIKFLETQENIDWWYKNGDKGKDYFAVPYNDNENLFYPDWFIGTKSGKIFIVDTKSGNTLKEGAKERIEALHKYIKAENLNGRYIAGIVAISGDVWKININETYNYDNNLSEFTSLVNLLG